MITERGTQLHVVKNEMITKVQHQGNKHLDIEALIGDCMSQGASQKGYYTGYCDTLHGSVCKKQQVANPGMTSGRKWATRHGTNILCMGQCAGGQENFLLLM